MRVNPDVKRDREIEQAFTAVRDAFHRIAFKTGPWEDYTENISKVITHIMVLGNGDGSTSSFRYIHDYETDISLDRAVFGRDLPDGFMEKNNCHFWSQFGERLLGWYILPNKRIENRYEVVWYDKSECPPMPEGTIPLRELLDPQFMARRTATKSTRTR